jgi:pentatricopeptide repeat protein
LTTPIYVRYFTIQSFSRPKRNQYEGIVSVAAVNCVIRACGRSSRPDIAVQILNEMQQKYGVSPDEMSYRLAIIACNQAEHRETRQKQYIQLQDPPAPLDLTWWQCALSLLRRMTEDGLQPDAQTYSSVVSACESGKGTSSNS